MAARYQVVSVKLDRDLRAKLYTLAQQRHRSPHSMMKEAIARYVLREEVAMWTDYLATHKTLAPQLVGPLADLMPPSPRGLPDHIAKQIADGHNRLRVIRGWRGMSLGRLVAAIEDIGGSISESRLDAIEDGAFNPGPGLIAVLAKVLDVSVEDLMG